jgi:hypothetical protein
MRLAISTSPLEEEGGWIAVLMVARNTALTCATRFAGTRLGTVHTPVIHQLEVLAATKTVVFALWEWAAWDRRVCTAMYHRSRTFLLLSLFPKPSL